MKNNFFLFLIFFVGAVFGAKTINDSLYIKASGSGKGGSVVIDSGLSVGKLPVIASPTHVVTPAGSAGVLRSCPVESLAVGTADSSRVSGHSDESDTAYVAGEADHAGSCDTADSARVSGYSDSSRAADHSDTADFAHHSPATPHTVGIDTFAYANSDTTFEGGNLFRRGDTTVIGVQSSEEFVASGVTIPAAGPHYISENSTGDIFAAVDGNLIYKQTGGSGSFSATTATPKSYSGIWVDIYDTIWVCVDSGTGQVGAVFKSGDDGVTWDSLSWPNHNYSGGTSDTSGNIYISSYGPAAGSGGKIWVKYNGVDTLDTLSEALRYYRGMCCNEKNNDIYVAVSFGNIYKRAGGVGAFAPQTHSIGDAGVNWGACAVDTFGNAYATSSNYYQFKQQDGVGTFTPIQNSHTSATHFTGITGKINGDVAATKGAVYILSAEGSKIAFHIESGKFLSDGANILNHTVIDDTPDLIAGKNTIDNMVIYARPESLSVDSARACNVADYVRFIGATIHSHDDTIPQTMSTSYKIDSVFMYTESVNNIPIANVDTTGDRIILNYNGYWNVEWHASVYSGSAGINLRSALFLNETELDHIHDQVKFATGNDFQKIGVPGTVHVTDAPDTLTLRSRADSGSPTLNFTYSALKAEYAGTD